jgi:hypothetical protein
MHVCRSLVLTRGGRPARILERVRDVSTKVSLSILCCFGPDPRPVPWDKLS